MYTPFMDPVECRLITAASQRDSQAFHVLYQRYLPLICKLWYQFELPRTSLEDWQQEAAIVLYRSACRFKKTDVCFCSYVRQALLNRIRDLYRQQAAKKRVPFGCLNYLNEKGAYEYMENSRPRPDEVSSLRKSYAYFLGECSPLERRAFLTINRGISIRQAALRWHCPPRRIRSALGRAQKKLRDALQ